MFQAGKEPAQKSCSRKELGFFCGKKRDRNRASKGERQSGKVTPSHQGMVLEWAGGILGTFSDFLMLPVTPQGMTCLVQYGSANVFKRPLGVLVALRLKNHCQGCLMNHQKHRAQNREEYGAGISWSKVHFGGLLALQSRHLD